MSLASGAVAGELSEQRVGHAPPVVPAFDGFRGAAAMLIVVYHCWLLGPRPSFGLGPLQALFAGSALGVDIFFVISGFVLFLPVVRTGSFGSIRAYALRRAGRIIPAYYVVIVFVLVFWNEITVPIPQFVHPLHDGDGVIAVLSQLLFVQNLVIGGPLMRAVGYDTARSIAPLAVTWSLTVELCFYLVLPLVAGRFARRPLAWLAGCVALAMAWRLMCVNLDSVASLVGSHPSAGILLGLRHQLLTQLPAFAGHFALGMTLAWVFVRANSRKATLARLAEPRVGTPALVVTGVAVLLTWWWWGHESMRAWNRGSVLFVEDGFAATGLAQLAFAAAFTAFAACVILGPATNRWPWCASPARWLGDVSYGVFLWHYVALHFIVFNLHLKAAGPDENFFAYFVCVTALALVAAALSRRFVEQPVLNWARRVSKRWSGRPAAVSEPVVAPVPV